MRGKTIYGKGKVQGNAVVIKTPISFLGDIDGLRGVIKVNDGEKPIAGRILILPYSRGSTVGPYIMYQLVKYGNAPLAILTINADTLMLIGSVMAGIPLVTNLPDSILNINDGAVIIIDLDKGEINVE
ncbi:MAG: aconitase X swivel domain-containing protein [Thermocladium sp.]